MVNDWMFLDKRKRKSLKFVEVGKVWESDLRYVKSYFRLFPSLYAIVWVTKLSLQFKNINLLPFHNINFNIDSNNDKTFIFNKLKKFFQASGNWLKSTSHRSNGLQISISINQQPKFPIWLPEGGISLLSLVLSPIYPVLGLPSPNYRTMHLTDLNTHDKKLFP